MRQKNETIRYLWRMERKKKEKNVKKKNERKNKLKIIEKIK